MNLRRCQFSILAFLLLAGTCRQATAAISYLYVTDKPTYTIPVGQSLTVNVYLQETLTAGSASVITADNGVFGAGFEVLSAARPANPSAITVLTPNALFTGGPFTNMVNNPAIVPSMNPNEADFVGGLANNAVSGVGLANGNGAAANQVFFGSLTIVGGSTPGTTTFSLGEYDVSGGSGGNTITFNHGFDLDNSRTGSPAYTGVGTSTTTFSVTTNSVPEPGSIALVGLCACGVLMRRRRRA